MKICIKEKPVTRQSLANPFSESYDERLIKTKAVDLRDNYKIEDLGNGYCKVEPIDKTQIYK